VTLLNFDVRFTPESGSGPNLLRPLASRLSAGGSANLQILFYRGISDRHVNQSSILKPRDELVVFDRIEGDATGAPPEHAIIFGAKSSGGADAGPHHAQTARWIGRGMAKPGIDTDALTHKPLGNCPPFPIWSSADDA